MSTLSGSHGLSAGRARRTKSKVRSIPDIFLSPQTHLSDPFFFKQIAEEKTDFATKLRKLGQNMKRYMWHGDLLCITHTWWMWRRNVRFLHISHVIREIREICHTEISEISPHDRFSPQVPPGKYQVWLDQPQSLYKKYAKDIAGQSARPRCPYTSCFW